MALCVTAASSDWSIPVKLAACGVLSISHIATDAIPHLHWYNFATLKKNRQGFMGAFVELFGGLVLLPIILGWYFHLNFFWLGAFVLSANASDILVAAKISSIILINHKAHFWAEKVKGGKLVLWEAL